MAFILNIVLMNLGGITAVAVMSIVLYVDSLMVMTIFGMCNSMQPPISYCYTAGLKKRVASFEKRVLSLAAFIFLRYGANKIVPLFVQPGDTELLQLSVQLWEFILFPIWQTGYPDACPVILLLWERPFSHSLLQYVVHRFFLSYV